MVGKARIYRTKQQVNKAWTIHWESHFGERWWEQQTRGKTTKLVKNLLPFRNTSSNRWPCISRLSTTQIVSASMQLIRSPPIINKNCKEIHLRIRLVRSQAVSWLLQSRPTIDFCHHLALWLAKVQWRATNRCSKCTRALWAEINSKMV